MNIGKEYYIPGIGNSEYTGEGKKHFIFGKSKLNKKKIHMVYNSNREYWNYIINNTPKKVRDIARKKRQLEIKYLKKFPELFSNDSLGNYLLEIVNICSVEYAVVLINCIGSKNYTPFYVVPIYVSKKKEKIIYPSFYSQGIKIKELELVKSK